MQINQQQINSTKIKQGRIAIRDSININQPNNMIKSTIKLIRSIVMSQENCHPLDHTPVNLHHTFKNSFLQSMPIPFTN